MASIEDELQWARCAADSECTGARVHADCCLAHLDEDGLSGYLQHVVSGAAQLDARGVHISSALLTRVLDAMPRSGNGGAILDNPNFERATFTGIAGFFAVHFKHGAAFVNTTFEHDAIFEQAVFDDPRGPSAMFDRAIFRGPALFGQPLEIINEDPTELAARVLGAARFGQAQFEDVAIFRGVAFGFHTSFAQATFKHTAEFAAATFDGQASFAGTFFADDASFRGARFGQTLFGGVGLEQVGAAYGTRFGGNVSFHGATFTEYAHLAYAMFESSAVFEGANFKAGVGFDYASFRGDVSLARTTVAPAATFRSTVFEGRVRMTDVHWPNVTFEDARFADVAVLQASDVTRVVSLRRADLTGLSVANVDLRPCRLDGARSLDRLSIGSRVTFAAPPPRCTRRKVLAEECLWRAHARKRWRKRGWASTHLEVPEGMLDEGESPPPRVVAELYRNLRKGQEDRSNQPDAADFYYGEMEMRRHDVETPRSERAIIWVYWATSGYALRASRAFAWLAAVLVIFAALFYAFGFHTSQPFVRALFVSFTAIAFREVPHISLTFAGDVLSAMLRIIGPALLLVGILSLRGRVKR